MSLLLAIDPGPEESGWIELDFEMTGVNSWDYALGGRAVDANWLVRERVMRFPGDLAIEMIASYGMSVGASVFDTCRWVGRFEECFKGQATLVYRRDVKLHVCNSPRATDANVRTALIDRFGKPGTKKKSGPTYGIKSHIWSALAVGVTWVETLQTPEVDVSVTRETLASP